MVQMKMRFKDVMLVRQGLENTADELPKVGRLNIFRRLQKLIRELKIYPPKRPGQKYVRRFQMRRNWNLLRANDDGYMIRNRARRNGKGYVQWVVGDAFGNKQAKIHRGRWYVFRDKMEEVIEDLPKLTSQQITIVARRQRAFKAAI